MRGALRVLCIGAPDHRLEVASEIGASDTLNFEKHDEQKRLEWILERTNGRGADVCVDAVGFESESSFLEKAKAKLFQTRPFLAQVWKTGSKNHEKTSASALSAAWRLNPWT